MCKYFSLHKFNLLDTGCLLFHCKVHSREGSSVHGALVDARYLDHDRIPQREFTLSAVDVKSDSARTSFCTEKLKHSTVGTR